ncbi:hypothetical protein LLS1_03930 [Leifsonia sp. LS1]|uniref:hypothetical protein n=1 Tax=Leifsonia sp. LS1 TaxID=2828483 RepID=UPI001CFCFD46|nr:hypothetical protein [Leifsonia sp. LS1]GIT78724.1 hypothetical protein LLS1_03930 [Leifsonia sp. LS1]
MREATIPSGAVTAVGLLEHPAGADEAETVAMVGERPYAWVLPALPAEVERVVVALERRQRERSRGSLWRRAAALRLRPLDREMAAVRELRELATEVLDRRGGNRYGAVVPVSEVVLLQTDREAWAHLLALGGLAR